MAEIFVGYLLEQERSINIYYILTALMNITMQHTLKNKLISLQKFFLDPQDGEINHTSFHWKLDNVDENIEFPRYGD